MTLSLLFFFGISWVLLFVVEGLVKGLTWELCGQEENIGLENNSSLPSQDKTKLKNL